MFWSHLLRGAVPEDVSHSSTLVAGLGASIGTIFHNVTNLVTVVAGIFLLAAVPGDVSGAVALVAPVLLLAALPGKVAEPVALVALAAASTVPAAASKSTIPESASETSATSSAAPTVTVVHAISLGTLAGKVADPVAAVTHGTSGSLAIRAFAGKVASPVTLVAHTFLSTSSPRASASPALAANIVISRVGALTGKVTRTLAAVTNHFDTRSFSGILRILL